MEQQIKRWRKYGSPLPVFYEQTKVCVIYDEENITSKTNASNPQIGDPCHTLGRTGAGRTLLCQCYTVDRVDACENHAQDGRYKLTEKVPTLSSKMGQGGDNVPYALYTYVGNSSGDDVAGTIDSSYYKGTGSRSGNEREVVCMGFLPLAGEKCGSVAETENGSPTLRATSPTAAVIALDRSSYNQGKNAQYDIGIDTEGIAFTVTAKGPGAVCYEEKHDYCVRIREGKDGGGKGALVQRDKSGTLGCGNDQIVFHNTQTQYVVRRLTPLECCRLQGMPDWWEDDVAGADAPRYKMWGNGMALPNALYVMEGFYER